MRKIRWFRLLVFVIFGIAFAKTQGADSAPVITLERTACFGTCPVYTISLFADGTVVYEGSNFVTATGQQIGAIAPETVATMVEAFRAAGYFDWNDSYETQMFSDLPSVITSVTDDGTTHRIAHDMGDATAPIALPFLEQWIDAMTNTILWTGVQPDISVISNGTNTPLITLQHGPNFGFGSVYNIAAYEDGTVVYMGIANVATQGVYVFHIDAAIITNIAQNAQFSGYFDWQDRYEERIITDQATIVTSVRWDDQYKRIVRYDGDPNAPIGIVRIEESIGQLVTDLVG